MIVTPSLYNNEAITNFCSLIRKCSYFTTSDYKICFYFESYEERKFAKEIYPRLIDLSLYHWEIIENYTDIHISFYCDL